jgi:FkbM family methyltransferase
LDRVEKLRQRFGFLVDVLRIRQLVSFVLGVLPIQFRQGGMTVPIRCWSDILAYNEIFRVRVYDAVLTAEAPNAVCDLGCQSGLMILRMASLGCAPRKALLIDANPSAIARCRANLKSARLERYSIIHGAVGCSRNETDWQGRTVQFGVRPSELECRLATSGRQKGDKVIDVPVVDLETAWIKSIGDVPCELLKMDVEGAEVGVLENDQSFLSRVQRVVLEWHEPFTNRRSAEFTLRGLGFVDVETICNGESSGVLFASKKRANC